MDSAVDLTKFGFVAGEKVLISDDEWSSIGRDIVIIDVEPVPGSTQCVVRAGNEIRTVSRGELRHR